MNQSDGRETSSEKAAQEQTVRAENRQHQIPIKLLRDCVASAASTPSGELSAYRCHQCGRGFLRQWELNAHFAASHATETLQRELTGGKSWNSAALSDDRLASMAVRLPSDASVLVGFRCPDCGHLAKWPTELQKHAMVHSCARLHVCAVCGRAYKWKWDLARHFRRCHHGLMNPYQRKRRPSAGGFSNGNGLMNSP